MAPFTLLSIVAALLLVAGVLEHWFVQRNLRKIRVRIHVNGTRGKSSVTRLLYAALREAGMVVCAKTTGTLARMILPDGRELPIYRPSGANIIEQRRIVATAAAYGAEVLVIECMALQPPLQSLCELKLVRATHGVVTNARPDHLDVMGPDAAAVARALAGMTPVKGRLYTAEREHLSIFQAAAEDRGTELVAVDEAAVKAVGEDDLARFAYREHPDNVALALRICEDLGVDRATALRGMVQAPQDPGALTQHELDFFGRRIVFLNGFAANDPVSTRQLWNAAVDRNQDVEARIAIFNCRIDRPDRSLQLGSDFVNWAAMDHVVLIGSGTYIFARAAVEAGFDPARIVLAETPRVESVFERIVNLLPASALVMGMGNIGGPGLELVRYFANRARLTERTSGRPAGAAPRAVAGHGAQHTRTELT